MHSRVLKFVGRVLALALVATMPVALAAQYSAKPAADDFAHGLGSKWNLFLGYSYIAPRGSVTTPAPEVPVDNSGLPTTTNYVPIPGGGIASLAYYFNRYVGIEAEGDFHVENEYPGVVWTKAADDMSGGSMGLLLQFPKGNWTPFVHALGGGERVAGPHWQLETWGPVVTGGGGLDYTTPLMNHHLAIRLFQLDYQYTHENFGPVTYGVPPPNPGVFGGVASINAARVSAGIVFHFASKVLPTPITLKAVANPITVFPCDPVTVTATAGNLDPKLHPVYSWAGKGVTGKGTIATVATCPLTPGTYTVRAVVQEGLKPWQVAEASASFVVKPFDPPTITCAANPSIIKPGETGTITATGLSPQNRPLTYSYSASTGTVSGSGSTATYASADAPSGLVTITCTATDDKGQIATATTSLTIAAPIQPVKTPSPEIKKLETRLALHSVFFPTDLPRIGNPHSGLVISQQATLTVLATDFKSYLTFKPDAHLTLSGHADVRGSVEYNKALSERRVARTKLFLVEQGIPEASIETRGLGKEQELTADQVKELVEQNPDLSAAERDKVFRDLAVIVLAQNRRVDVTLSTTGEQSVRLYPFNAADSLTLLDTKAPESRKKAAAEVQGTTPVDKTKVKPQTSIPPVAKPTPNKKAAAEVQGTTSVDKTKVKPQTSIPPVAKPTPNKKAAAK